MSLTPVRVLLLIFIVWLLNACASGSSIVTGTVRAPIDFNRVKLYTEAPEKYESIGIVKASSDAGWTEQGSQDHAIEELKKQAAKLGANGIVLTTTGVNTLSQYSEQTVTGKAIYIGE